MNSSIIIPTYKNLELTKKCLDAIKKNTQGDYEVIVVDDNSGDGTAEYLRAQDNIKTIINTRNLGFAKNCNAGARESGGAILIFLNNDTEVHAGWLEAIERVFAKESRAGAVGVKLLFPNGLIQHAGVVISPDKTPRHIYYEASAGITAVNKEREFQAVTAACIAIRRDVFIEAGGFDEEYRNGLEDVDLCLKIGKLGYKIIYTPQAVVTHHESIAPGRFKHNQHNADLYMSRWSNNIVSDEHKYYKEDGRSALWVLGQDLRSMSFGPNEYGTRPLYVSILRLFYIPLHKIYVLVCYLLKGDFKGLVAKIKGKYNV
ncbi:MAG: glycosyltransferase family 2 protein [Bacillota bacterium]|nr:glycosyltransferase family 2 protein [Bacillota bacterium]